MRQEILENWQVGYYIMPKKHKHGVTGSHKKSVSPGSFSDTAVPSEVIWKISQCRASSWFLFTYIPQHLDLGPLLPCLRFPLKHSLLILWLQPKSSKFTWLFKHTKNKTNQIYASLAFFLPGAWHSPVFCLQSWVFAVADSMTDRVHMPLSFSTALAPELRALLSTPQNSLLKC